MVDFFGGPEVVESFFAVDFGVLCAIETSGTGLGLACHFAEAVIEGAFCGASVELVVVGDGCAGVDVGELGVVVEHFFKMRDGPELIYGIPMEPPTDLVVEASDCHGVEGHFGCFVDCDAGIVVGVFAEVEEVFKVDGLGELWGSGESAVDFVEALEECGSGAGELGLSDGDGLLVGGGDLLDHCR